MTTIGFGLQPTGAPTCLAPFTIVFQTTGGSVIETLLDGAPPTNANPNPSTFGAFTARTSPPRPTRSKRRARSPPPARPSPSPPSTTSISLLRHHPRSPHYVTADDDHGAADHDHHPSRGDDHHEASLRYVHDQARQLDHDLLDQDDHHHAWRPDDHDDNDPEGDQAPHLSGIAALIKSKNLRTCVPSS